MDGGILNARPGVDLNGNGFQIMFMNGGKADFQGTPVFTWSNNGAKQNLSRDINFRNLRRIIFLDAAGRSTLRYFTISDSGTPTAGDFPLHFHLNGDSTRGTIVEGVVVVNGANHAFVPHGSHGITFKDVIAKNTTGDAFYWNPVGSNGCPTSGTQRNCTTDNSNDISYIHALADGVNGDGFVLRAGSGNVVRNSAAINVNPSKGSHCAAFYWPSDANLNAGGNVWVFENNHGVSRCNGIRVWQNGGNHHVINGFTGGGIEHGAYGNSYEYINVDVPYFKIFAKGVSIRDSRIKVVEVFNHSGEPGQPTAIFTNVQIERVVVNNGGNNGEVSGQYVFNNTGLTCGDIEYQKVVPGTQVIIDGEVC